jgi:hypothetical protein
MSFNVTTYSPSDVVFTMGGATLSGWDRITIKRNSPSYKMVRGIRGKNTRIKNPDTSATIEVVLTSTSESNQLFRNILDQDEKFGTGRLEISIKDTFGTEVFNTIEGYISSHPDIGYEPDISTRGWTIECLSSSFTNGEGWGVLSLFNSIF